MISWHSKMARTKSFSKLAQSQIKIDKKFAEALLREGIDAMLAGDIDTGKPPKSLIRMFGPRGNPQAKNLFSVIGYLQKRAGLNLHVAG